MALILVIDDETDACRLMERILSADGHRVFGFTEVEAAMRWLDDNVPDLAILDIKLQSTDGISLLKAMRLRDPFMKVIMIVGTSSVEAANLAIGQGIDAYLVKPLELDELEQRVASALALEQAR
ncbi:MAG: hypothetical protein AUK55_15400 [Syntrophobacteraceae bacterium CG2_30_61_12]|nr:MAG: hypothetical protein AUK55_15400 [Syntrophobacteraceae bacterium CG2_30_61_12]